PGLRERCSGPPRDAGAAEHAGGGGMNGASQMSPAQQSAKAQRVREGRLDTSAMSNRLRRALGLMDRQQAAEHERLRTLPHARLADRTRGPVPDDIWVLPAGGEPDVVRDRTPRP